MRLTYHPAVRVFLVESSPPVRERLRSLIAEAGAEVTAEAGTLAAARTLLAEAAPDAVVLDLNLPDGHGSVLLAELKRTRPECVVMVLANLAFPALRDFCVRLGADHFFEKSTEFERVAEVLDALAARQSHPPTAPACQSL